MALVRSVSGWMIGGQSDLELLEHDNVLCFVVEPDTRRVLDLAEGSLFGVIAEAVPISHERTLIGPPILRIDCGAAAPIP